jgi:hypothetical protein
LTIDNFSMYLYEALRSERGIAIRDPYPVALRTKLYGAKSNRPEFAELQFIVSPDGEELWITKGVKWQGKRDAEGQ